MPGIPEFIDPSKSCDKQHVLEGDIPVQRLARFLAQQVVGDTKENSQPVDQASQTVVHAKFSFRRDEQQHRIADVEYHTVAKLACQRCLGLIQQEIEGNVTFVFLHSDSGLEQLPKAYEPVLLENHEAGLWQALEDELLLSLPMFAYHEDRHCNRSLDEMKIETEGETRENPFAVLGDLLKK